MMIDKIFITDKAIYKAFKDQCRKMGYAPRKAWKTFRNRPSSAILLGNDSYMVTLNRFLNITETFKSLKAEDLPMVKDIKVVEYGRSRWTKVYFYIGNLPLIDFATRKEEYTLGGVILQLSLRLDNDPHHCKLIMETAFVRHHYQPSEVLGSKIFIHPHVTSTGKTCFWLKEITKGPLTYSTSLDYTMIMKVIGTSSIDGYKLALELKSAFSDDCCLGTYKDVLSESHLRLMRTDDTVKRKIRIILLINELLSYLGTEYKPSAYNRSGNWRYRYMNYVSDNIDDFQINKAMVEMLHQGIITVTRDDDNGVTFNIQDQQAFTDRLSFHQTDNGHYYNTITEPLIDEELLVTFLKGLPQLYVLFGEERIPVTIGTSIPSLDKQLTIRQPFDKVIRKAQRNLTHASSYLQAIKKQVEQRAEQLARPDQQ